MAFFLGGGKDDIISEFEKIFNGLQFQKSKKSSDINGYWNLLASVLLRNVIFDKTRMFVKFYSKKISSRLQLFYVYLCGESMRLWLSFESQKCDWFKYVKLENWMFFGI